LERGWKRDPYWQSQAEHSLSTEASVAELPTF
jgi:hypothetical protein